MKNLNRGKTLLRLCPNYSMLDNLSRLDPVSIQKNDFHESCYKESLAVPFLDDLNSQFHDQKHTDTFIDKYNIDENNHSKCSFSFGSYKYIIGSM